MFGLLKAKNPYEQNIKPVYGVLLERACQPVFYSDYGVSDTFEGRFDLLVLHIFLVMDYMLSDKRGEEFNQNLFDIMFADMDQALRQGGKGDMGVPKQMRYMMKAFNGRAHAYKAALGDDNAMEAALQLNLYNGQDDAPLMQMRKYIADIVSKIEKNDVERILGGEIELGPLKPFKKIGK